MFRVLLLGLLSLAFSATAAVTNYGSVLVDEVTSIYDADTFTVNVRKWPPIIGERVKVRIKGIDSPELKAECVKELQLARKAKQHTVERLRSARTIELRELGRDKYFRVLADVYVDGEDLGAYLIGLKLARAYDGGKKRGWCD